MLEFFFISISILTLQVLVHHGFKEIPEKYILRRWTKSAREGIPAHLEGYLKDGEAEESRCHRHSLLHKEALELIRLGDTSVETCRTALEGLAKLMDELKLMCNRSEESIKDSRRSERVMGKKPVVVEMEDSDEENSSREEDEDDEDISDPSEGEDDDILITQIEPPEYRRGRGRPKIKGISPKLKVLV